jgi:hypothetical protein
MNTILFLAVGLYPLNLLVIKVVQNQLGSESDGFKADHFTGEYSDLVPDLLLALSEYISMF